SRSSSRHITIRCDFAMSGFGRWAIRRRMRGDVANSIPDGSALSETRLQRIGFVGLGIMGLPMAGHLLKSGYALFVHSRTKSKSPPLLDGGAHWCDSPAAVAAQCDVMLTMVTDTPDVEAVLFGVHGAAESLVAGSVVVDLSTISPAAAREFAQRLAA